jgi:hypothetical protein
LVIMFGANPDCRKHQMFNCCFTSSWNLPPRRSVLVCHLSFGLRTPPHVSLLRCSPFILDSWWNLHLPFSVRPCPKQFGLHTAMASAAAVSTRAAASSWLHGELATTLCCAALLSSWIPGASALLRATVLEAIWLTYGNGLRCRCITLVRRLPPCCTPSSQRHGHQPPCPPR